jgi:hypothetical protein
MRKLTCLCVAVLLTFGVSYGFGDDEESDGHTIKEVMASHKGGADSLLARVVAGDATAEEQIELLDAYISLRENEPPKGDADNWHELTDAILIAASKVVAGREGAGEELKEAANCMACHSEHKP